MKKTATFLSLMSFLTTLAMAQSAIVVVNEPGTLEEALKEENLLQSYQLTVVGPINGADIRTLRHLCGGHDECDTGEEVSETLTLLNLEGADIKSGGGSFYYDGNWTASSYIYDTEDNKITHHMFANTTSLTEVRTPASAVVSEMLAFVNCPRLTKVVFNGLKTFNCYTFHNCPLLQQIVLPSTLTEMGGSGFVECPSLRLIVCHATEPPTIYLRDKGIDDMSNCDLLVPAGCKEAYLNAPFWKSFRSVTEMTSSAPTRVTEIFGDVTSTSYDISGRPVGSNFRGLQVIRKADGRVVKSLRK